MPPLSPFSKSCIALAVAQSMSLSAAQAANIEVTSSADDDGTGCTLREAIVTINVSSNQNNGCVIDETIDDLGANDTINFASGVAGETITLANGKLSIDRSVSINPDGDTTTIHAAGASRVVEISIGNVRLNRLVISGGLAELGPGGGIFAFGDSTTVTLSDSEVSGNTTGVKGGGIYVSSNTSLSLTNSSVSGNTADRGGGVFARHSSSLSLNNSTVSANKAANGGGINASDSSSVSLDNSMVSGNSATDGGGISAFDSSTVSLSNSTVSDNTATFNAGGLSARSSTISLDNSTVSGNTAGNGGGGVYARISSNVSLNNSTVSGNTAVKGGGLWVLFGSGLSLNNSTLASNMALRGPGMSIEYVASATLSNSIIANLGDVNACYTASDSMLSAGADTIAADNSCGAATVDDPRLGPLADNGGPTLTHALLSDSPAIDRATAAGATTLDQRGLGLVGTRDSGAFEAQRLSVSLTPEIIAENGGMSMGTVTRSGLIDRELSVNLSSSDPFSATVLPSVKILANATSATFTIVAVDDLLADGDVTSIIKANSIGYSEGSASIIVEDNEIAGLTLSVPPSPVSEGVGTVVATLGRNTPTTDALTVMLSSSDINTGTVPDSVTILEGESSVNFDIDVVDDLIADGNSVSTISANAVGFEPDMAELIVVDNDVPTLTLSLSLSSVNEDAGTLVATLSRNTPSTNAVTAILSSSDTNSATVPASVEISTGHSSVSFNVDVVDDQIADGNSISTISAAATGFAPSSTELTVLDNDIAGLTLTLNDSSIVEASTTTATVSRNTPNDSALNVTLSSNNPSAAKVPPMVEIPIGMMSANFTINGVDNTVIDTNREVIITASGLGGGTNAVVIVTDDDDDDGDAVADNMDNCPFTANLNQADLDGDGSGDACDPDIDGDGLPNSYELANGLDPGNSLDRDSDADGDGFSNFEEFEFGSDPQVPDQDVNGNGIPDAIENKRVDITPILLLLLDGS